MAKRERIWLSPPDMNGEELKYLKEVFASNWIAPVGPDITAFERELAGYSGALDVAALSSGTAAIHLAMKLLNIGPGDEVIVPSFTFTASANPVVYEGGTPVFVDSESETWNICPLLLEQAILSGIKRCKKPKAIVVVHLYGMPAKMEAIVRISREYDIPIIEDAAEALGASMTLDGIERKLGTIGDFGIFSFNGNKIITTSGGGALLAHNLEWLERARYLATQGRDPAPHYEHSTIAYNYRMSNVLAAIGRGQLKKLDDYVARRRGNFEYYQNRLGKLPGVSFLEEPEGFFSNRWLTTILLDPSVGITSDMLRLHLDSDQVEARPLWKPLHLQPVFASNRYFDGGICEPLFRQGLCLPSGSALTVSDLDRVCTNIEELFFIARSAGTEMQPLLASGM